jgi:hypothetical protein
MADASHQWQSFADETSANPSLQLGDQTNAEGEGAKVIALKEMRRLSLKSRTGTLKRDQL